MTSSYSISGSKSYYDYQTTERDKEAGHSQAG